MCSFLAVMVLIMSGVSNNWDTGRSLASSHIDRMRSFPHSQHLRKAVPESVCWSHPNTPFTWGTVSDSSAV
ncbi:hypothetical protein P691DRAFT_802012 [Macrolepiota fuliginosa MF-IS2]|uniref:Secreted protein n=1 Tax=Macrolepiota fuliginosa MF-IS2 TaxID=1400762 RepID=A0A9P5XKM4_9AGAR|nr:hypothetical protein P691DRAFT_802012 [Macrolepiota fuliginosa MF-IS2]